MKTYLVNLHSLLPCMPISYITRRMFVIEAASRAYKIKKRLKVREPGDEANLTLASCQA